ncbi:adenosine nucleotide hydrolase [Deinococcus koreensis]|uniref:Adenosine nucleotide hydrolase n=1 Tax=Deinococcus koreensis TaxID=2054903 RepID=A0A2K3UX09_9DEIO|nr:adenosine nucleotide hydrolase [Deinococcus koreensis]
MSLESSSFVTSWSGGKDSALAYHRATRAGGRPLAILTVLDENGERTRSHGLRPEVMRAQADALGVPLWTARASWAAYEAEFTALLARAARAGASRAVFGDIDLQAHRDWEEGVCARAGLEPHLPLWLEDRRPLVDDLLRLGFRALIVAVREDALPTDLLGRELDAPLVREIEALGADACGENGEYHTVLVNGPDFRNPLNLVPGPAGIHHTGEGSLRVATLDLVLA